jgi:hypothetical protein
VYNFKMISTRGQTTEGPVTTDSDTPGYAHYAESGSVTEGYITGRAVVAICGKIFVPSRDPKKFLVCPRCTELADALFLRDKE